MLIEIKKISKKTLWYAGLLGERFEVVKENENDFEIKNPLGIKVNTYYIFKEDAKIINN